jgi:hypothetical protein
LDQQDVIAANLRPELASAATPNVTRVQAWPAGQNNQRVGFLTILLVKMSRRTLR